MADSPEVTVTVVPAEGEPATAPSAPVAIVNASPEQLETARELGEARARITALESQLSEAQTTAARVEPLTVELESLRSRIQELEREEEEPPAEVVTDVVPDVGPVAPVEAPARKRHPLLTLLLGRPVSRNE